MWIMVSKSDKLIKAAHFAVVRNIGGKKDEKFLINVFSNHHNDYGTSCAAFPDEDSAKAELAKVAQAIAEGKTFYKFSDEEPNRYAD